MLGPVQLAKNLAQSVDSDLTVANAGTTPTPRLDSTPTAGAREKRPSAGAPSVERSGLARPRLLQSSAASRRARSIAASSIAGVRRPVKVFCWLGWYEPSSR